MPFKANTLENIRRALSSLLLDAGAEALPIWFVASQEDAAIKELSAGQRRWLQTRDWTPKPGTVLLLPADDGSLAGAFGVGHLHWHAQVSAAGWWFRRALPPGDWRFATPLAEAELAAFAWLTGSYRFARYKSARGGWVQVPARSAARS